MQIDRLTNATAKPQPKATADLPAPEPTTTAAPAGSSVGQDSNSTAAPSGVNSTSKMTLGAGGGSAPAARDVRDFDRFIQNQGDSNGCGTTSLAANLSFWKGKPEAYTRTQIDEKIRFGPDKMAFTSPSNIEGYAKDQGFRSNAKNNGSMDELKGFLDKGVPVQVLYDPNGNGDDELLHYVNVVDYTPDDQGGVKDIKIADPATGTSETMPKEEFEKRWDDLHLKGFDTGLNNVMLVHLPGENTPVRGKDGKTTMSNDIDLPEGGLGFSGAIADLVSDGINSLNPVGTIKNAWHSVFG